MRPAKSTYLLIALSALFLNSCGASRDTSIKVYDLGSRVEVGHLIYTVFETQWVPQIGAGDSARVPKHRFFLVRLSAVNSGSEDLDVPNVTLVDDAGKSTEEMQDGDQVPQWVGFIRKVKPADSISGNVVFDAEPRHYRLRVTDENGEKSAFVDIPLNFNADAPPVPVPSGGAAGGSSPDFSTPVKK
jgi:Domain of unknown function (DUF4352)